MKKMYAHYIYTLVFIKVDISEIYISFVLFRETKEKTKDIYISYTSTFLKTSVYIYIYIYIYVH